MSQQARLYLKKSFQLYKEEILGKYVFTYVPYHKFRDTTALSEIYNSGSPQVKFTIDIFIKYDIAYTAVSNLSQSIGFMTLHPVPEYYKFSGIKEIDYYKYHFENFYVRCASSCDYFSHFINHALQLKIKSKDCTLSKVQMVCQKSHPRIHQNILKLNQDLNNLKSDRVRIIHYGDFQSSRIQGLQKIIFDIQMNKNGFTLHQGTEKEKREELIDIAKEMESTIELIESHFFNISELLIKPIQKMYKSFESKKHD